MPIKIDNLPISRGIHSSIVAIPEPIVDVDTVAAIFGF